MKKSLLIAALTTLVLSAPLASADDDHHPAGKGKKQTMPMTDQDKQMHMTKMQENMLKMHEQMHKIMDAKNPQEREQLMQEHAKIMQDSMRMMQGMMGIRGMMGGKMDGGMKGM